jgi:hypothetical protein
MMLAAALLLSAIVGAPPAWSAADIANEKTIELRTTSPEEGEHWSTVWFVVIDDALYVRLGPRAAGRIERNTTAPHFAIRVGGRDVRPMRYEPAPEKAGEVAEAMARKYWTDVLGEPFRKLGLTSPPLVLRLATDGDSEP